jgi:8-oxo-dGTP diphosphatase
MTETVPETARLTADVVAISEHDGMPHVLVIRRGWDPYAGCWALPGGHVDQGEDTADAALRELKEETGIEADNLEFVRVYSEPGRDPRGRYVTFAYVARVDGLPKPTAADDATDAMWVPARELTPRSLAFDHWQIIQDALRIIEDAR